MAVSTLRKDALNLICTGPGQHANTVQPWAKKVPTKCMVATCRQPLEKFDGRRHGRS